MASELNQLLYEYLQHLPSSHPDRRFLEGIQEAVAGYVDQTIEQPIGETLPPDDRTRTTAEPVPAATAPQRSEQTAAVEQERIRLDGRLGAAVSFRKTRNNVHIARFPIATRNDDDTTAWHTVLAFNKLADQLFANRPAKGAQVTVIGYKHPREVVGRDGIPKAVEDIYAVAVKVR